MFIQPDTSLPWAGTPVSSDFATPRLWSGASESAGIPRRDLNRTLEWKDKLAEKPSNFSSNPYSSFQPLHPAFQKQYSITEYKSIFRTVRYMSYIPFLSLNFPIYKAYVISSFFILPIECRDGRMRYSRRENCVNSKCSLLISVSSFHCPAPWPHSAA